MCTMKLSKIAFVLNVFIRTATIQMFGYHIYSFDQRFSRADKPMRQLSTPRAWNIIPK